MNTHDTGTATAAEAHDTNEETQGSVHDIGRKDEIRDMGFRTEHLKSGWHAYEVFGDRKVPENGDGFGSIQELAAAVREEIARTGLSDGALQPGTDNGDEDEFDAVENIIDAEEVDDDESDEFPTARIDEGNDPDEDEDEDEDDEFKTVEIEEDTGGVRLPGVRELGNHELNNAVLKYHSIKMDRVSLTAKEIAARDEMKLIAAKHEDLFVPDPDNTGCVIYNAAGIICRKRITHDEKFETEESKGDEPKRRGKKNK